MCWPRPDQLRRQWGEARPSGGRVELGMEASRHAVAELWQQRRLLLGDLRDQYHIAPHRLINNVASKLHAVGVRQLLMDLARGRHQTRSWRHCLRRRAEHDHALCGSGVSMIPVDARHHPRHPRLRGGLLRYDNINAATGAGATPTAKD